MTAMPVVSACAIIKLVVTDTGLCAALRVMVEGKYRLPNSAVNTSLNMLTILALLLVG